MQADEARQIIERQRRFFASGRTRGLAFRLAQLEKLREALQVREKDLLAALHRDLGKSGFEAYASEIGFVHAEIRHVMKNLSAWVKPIDVPTPLLHQPSRSRIHVEPKGLVLVIGPWNYPMQLLFAPLIAAIAAGNCVVLKPSEHAPATAVAVATLIERTFSPDYCAVIPGGIPEAEALLAQRFDHIFFTGSAPVARVVARAAAEHLTPVTLELGGKSPCLVDEGVDLNVAARRIVWGKFYNAGQTCVAPDYLLVPRKVKQPLLVAMRRTVEQFFGADPKASPDYGRIINERHFDRLLKLLHGANIYMGGEHDRENRYLAPTIVDDVSLADPVMADEIFGPILPVMTYETLDDALAIIKERPYPLACYIFTNRKAVEERVLAEVPFGGGCVNNTLLHLANPHLPFGGIGESGMGAYHGKFGFDTFSHAKGVMHSSLKLDVALKYPPYGSRLGLLKRLMG